MSAHEGLNEHVLDGSSYSRISEWIVQTHKLSGGRANSCIHLEEGDIREEYTAADASDYEDFVKAIMDMDMGYHGH